MLNWVYCMALHPVVEGYSKSILVSTNPLNTCDRACGILDTIPMFSVDLVVEDCMLPHIVCDYHQESLVD